jgi:DegV family protein with EDD domain
MAKVKIVTDSTALLTKEERERFDIKVVPLSVMIDGETYVDGVTISPAEFMAKMAESKNLPSTSQPAIGRFTSIYETLDEDAEILSIHVTHHMSGTVQAAQQAADIVDRDVLVHDSNYIDRALAYQVLKAAEMAEAGASRDDILTAIADVEEKTDLYLTVNTLKNVVAGGRLPKVAGIIGGLLDIRLGARVPSGEITIETKGRGKKTIKAYQDLIIERMQNAENGVAVFSISHANALAEAEEFAARVRNALPEVTIHIGELTPIEATHGGEGSMGISYLKN